MWKDRSFLIWNTAFFFLLSSPFPQCYNTPPVPAVGRTSCSVIRPGTALGHALWGLHRLGRREELERGTHRARALATEPSPSTRPHCSVDHTTAPGTYTEITPWNKSTHRLDKHQAVCKSDLRKRQWSKTQLNWQWKTYWRSHVPSLVCNSWQGMTLTCKKSVFSEEQQLEWKQPCQEIMVSVPPACTKQLLKATRIQEAKHLLHVYLNILHSHLEL